MQIRKHSDTLRINMKKTSILRDYRTRSGKSPKDFAAALGISVPTLRSYENGWRTIPAELCNQIEKHTKRAIKREQLRPEVFGRQAA